MYMHQDASKLMMECRIQKIKNTYAGYETDEKQFLKMVKSLGNYQ